MNYEPVNLKNKLNVFQDHWSPKIIAQMNDYYLKLVKFQGDFVWHCHSDTDETFLVIEGEMQIDFRDGKVTLENGELFVVPKGIEHKPYAENECQILLIEPKGTINTGETRGKLTADEDTWI